MAQLRELERLGQSAWLDDLHRGLLRSGRLAGLVREGLRGVTANPSIFEKGITGTDDYREALRGAARGPGADDPQARYEALAVEDVQAAADLLHPVFVETEGADGLVSLEVSPHLAHDEVGTVEEARRVWAAIGRPNAMIKVPGTPEGMPAVGQLVESGVSVNVTLLFSLEAYGRAADAFVSGLERRLEAGRPLAPVASVASFFVSRIDVAVDRRLAALGTPAAEALRGRAAVANARHAFQRAQELLDRPRWARLAAAGARPQRLLWASTSNKDPSGRDVRYVEELIGPGTVDTMPLATLEAFLDHGRVRPSLVEGIEEARATLARLEEVGISLEAVAATLLDEGVAAFTAAFDRLLGAVARAGPARPPARTAPT